MPKCPWCVNPDNDHYSDHLCRMHLAEYEGLSLDELDRMEREQSAELADWR